MPDNEPLLRELYAGLEVIKAQQTEINRRVGRIERSVEDDIAPLSRVVALEQAGEKRTGWIEEGVRLIAQAVVLTFAWWAASKIGVDLKW